jgi:hypothetical protein
MIILHSQFCATADRMTQTALRCRRFEMAAMAVQYRATTGIIRVKCAKTYGKTFYWP